MAQDHPTLSIIVPVYNGACDLERCLTAVFKSDTTPYEVIVVNDGSEEADVDRVIASFDVISVRSDTNIGRGPARNLGVDYATGTYLVFLDADVEIPPQALGNVQSILARRPNILAFFGSYDDAPACANTISQYRNLLHHHTHQTAPAHAPHFWTGFGVVKTSVFHQIGGFDTGKWARNMEEVEFGHRLNMAGHHIEVVKNLQVKHLKSYDLQSMIKSDLLDRAIPWTMFMRETSHDSNDFVTSGRQKWSAVAVAMILSLISLPLIGNAAILISFAGFVLFIALNSDFFSVCFRKKGGKFAFQSAALHLVHVFCAGLGYAIGTAMYLQHAISKRLGGNRPTSTENSKIGHSLSRESDL